MKEHDRSNAQRQTSKNENLEEHPETQRTAEPFPDQDASTESRPEPTCYECVYAQWDPGRWLRQLMGGWPSRPLCTIDPDAPGTLREVPPGGACKHFRRKWTPPQRIDPPEPPNDDVRYIALTKGKLATVDAADYEWLIKHKWSVTAGGYACRMENRKMIYMHREIMQPPPGMCVDHIDGDRLLNRRCNLRICTHRDNMRNRRKNKGSKLPKGVFRRKGSDEYCAKIGYNGEQIIIGTYDDPTEAARAYDQKAKELFGEFARLNFPDEAE